MKKRIEKYLQHCEHEILQDCVETDVFMLGVDILEVHDDVVLQKLAKALVLTPQQVEK